MAQPKIKFRFYAPCDGGHSLLKIVAFDYQGNSIPIRERYTFNGRFAPESGKPMQYEKAENIEKGVFRNFDVALTWATGLWAKLDKSNVAHGFIADADFPRSGKIWQKIQLTTMAKLDDEKMPYLYCLRMKLTNGHYLELRTIGQIDEFTGELQEDYKSCLRDLQAQYTRWMAYHPEEARRAVKAMVFGDGKKYYGDTKNIELWRMDFNAQTMQFSRKGRRDTLKIHDDAVMKAAQDFEEMLSNCIA